MQHNRRNFLLLATGAIAAAFDPELALWIPGKKRIILPASKVFTIADQLKALEIAQRDPVTALALRQKCAELKGRELRYWLHRFD